MDADETYRVAIEADTRGFERALADLSGQADRFGAALGSALKGAIIGGRSLDGVLRTLAARLSSIALDAALKPLEQLVSAGIGQALSGLGALGSSLTPGAGGGRVVPFAKGGIVSAPTFFPTGRQMGLMGEAGAEAVLPLRRGADGALGVALQGDANGPGGRGVQVVMNVWTPDAASFKRSGAQIEAMLARAAGRGRRGL